MTIAAVIKFAIDCKKGTEFEQNKWLEMSSYITKEKSVVSPQDPVMTFWLKIMSSQKLLKM